MLDAPDISIVSGGFQIGKHPTSCEDAFFIHERGFGVADGVSGWNDYGFSSSAFSTQLMVFSQEEIDKCLEEGQAKSKQKKNQLKKSASYLSMENLDIQEEDETNPDDEDGEEGNDSKPDENADTPSKSKLNTEQMNVEPTYILEKAFRRLTAVGSSTALIGIRNQKNISIANLGDSGFILIRFRNGEPYAAKRS